MKIDLSKIDTKKLTKEELAELDYLLEQEHISDMEKNLYPFFLEAWKVLEPKTELVDSWHYRLICEWLQMVKTGEFKKRYPEADGIIFNVPPRSLKSTVVSIVFPSWCWTTEPEKQFIGASYALGLSVKLNIKRRDLLRSKWYQDRWGKKFSIKEDADTKEHFVNTKTGHMLAAGVRGVLTGHGGNILILDDPLNPEEAASDADRKTANRWTDDTFLTRKNDPSKDVCVVVMQRLHEDDVTGMLLEKKGKWVHVSIPLVCEQDTVIEFPLSRKKFTRKAGDVLTPDRNTPIVVAGLQMSPRKYAGQFQQRPAPAEGNIIKRSWIRYWEDSSDANSPLLPEKFDRLLISVDCTFKGNVTSDFVSILVVGIKGANRFLIDRVYRQMSFTATVKAIQEVVEKYPEAKEIIIESKANGEAVIDTLKDKVTGIIPFNPKGDKKERLESASYSVESGNWYFPHKSKCPWVDEFIENLVCFPAAKHDDDVDAFSQAELRIGKRGTADTFLAAYDQLLIAAGKKTEPEPTPDEEVAA